MNADKLKIAIAHEQARLNEVAWRGNATTETFREYEAIYGAIVSYERQLQLCCGLPAVLPLAGWTSRWTYNHSKVRLVTTEKAISLEFLSYSTDPSIFAETRIEALHGIAAKHSLYDNDLIDQHPLYHSGLEGLGAFMVENSTWVHELHPVQDNEKYNHYLFCFIGCIVEILASDLNTHIGEGRRGTPPANPIPDSSP